MTATKADTEAITEIIDAHIHLWDPYTTPRTMTPAVKLLGRYPRVMEALLRLLTPKVSVNYFKELDLFVNPYLPADHWSRAGKYKLKGVVHIQADWHTKTPLGLADETAWLETLDPKPLAIIGEAHLNDVENLDAILDAHMAASPRFRGIRDMLAYHASKHVYRFNKAPDTMTTDAFRQGYARLGERDLSFDAFIFSAQLDDLCDLVEAYPNTRIVVDHVATPVGLLGSFCDVGTTADERAQIQAQWYDGLERLAQSSHVMMKLSGLFMPVLGWQHQRWTEPHTDHLSVDEIVDTIGPHLRFALDTFGVDRCMFASNFPPDHALVSFESYYAAYFKIVSHLDDGEKRKLFHDNAARFYRID